MWILLLKFKGKVDSMTGKQVTQLETSSFEVLSSKIPVGMTLKVSTKCTKTLVSD